ncbi:MAG TPA: hypothetical protein VLL94_10745, partial [Nitrospiraceae bacterium]|nr:hypothetical protein [Nitrospiraceae bacterium]
MADGADGAQARQPVDHRLEALLVAEEQEMRAGESLTRNIGAPDHHLRSVVATHRIQRDSQAGGHPPISFQAGGFPLRNQVCR